MHIVVSVSHKQNLNHGNNNLGQKTITFRKKNKTPCVLGNI